MVTYGLEIAKANIIEHVMKLVTEDIQWCHITCNIKYIRDWNTYNVNIVTLDSIGGYLKLGEVHMGEAVRKVFSLKSGARIGVDYNSRHIGSFVDKE